MADFTNEVVEFGEFRIELQGGQVDEDGQFLTHPCVVVHLGDDLDVIVYRSAITPDLNVVDLDAHSGGENLEINVD